MKTSYELVVIGGGPGGYVAALHAAELGKKTALIEADFLGGTCLNRGCIPSKTYLKHSEIIEQIEKAKDWGIETGSLTLSFDKMKKRKNDVIERLRGGIAFLLKQGKIDVYNGWGSLLADASVRVKTEAGEETIQAAKVIVATGSTPAVPPIPGLDSVQFDTSDTIFDIPAIPKSVVIIGGGVIGVEFATIFASLKTDVTIVEAAERIIPTEDAEASKLLAKVLKKKGIKLYVGAKVQKVVETAGVKTVIFGDEKGKEFSLEAETLLVSTGRRPNLSAVKEVSLEKSGPFLKVNDQMETSMANVYAIGDVIGGWQLAHAASAEGVVAANNAAEIHDRIDYKVMPRCIYTLPEIASVGLSEDEARKQGIEVRTEKFDFAGSGKALSAGEPEGFTKVIFEAKYGEIIGVVMAGSHVTEMISEASAFMYLEGTVEEAAKMIHPHPTISETFFEVAVKAAQKLKKEVQLI
ncbi:dihydrolipoyl dehydrogenase [Neobacillus sp. MM2021_6]|uniref:dihydrolipoyl dehydrogenase n=1 Tax=Bacillaceae TaxID=186817 RepID=UPI001409F653|nr:MULTISPECIES: dihydrolipoyl dehydrogenase [Bacillaceae]MBO0958656.1 dihydrolipoyl dehydrogenase [Neobacillus sp. MM2021_6]NHC20204.1 dihydrolipoyl dehydrogenase [Bacillus sp. MM2020_4]